MTSPVSMSRREMAAFPLSRWLLALITAGLSADEALSVISQVQLDQYQTMRKAA